MNDMTDVERQSEIRRLAEASAAIGLARAIAFDKEHPNCDRQQGTPASAFEAIAASEKSALMQTRNFLPADVFISLLESVSGIVAYMADHRADFERLLEEAAELKAIAPYIMVELEAAKDDPALRESTVSDVIAQGIDADGKPTQSPFGQLVERAELRKAEYEAKVIDPHTAFSLIGIDDQTPKVQHQKVDLVEFTLDKVNSQIWRMIDEDTYGQLTFAMEKQGSKNPLDLVCSIDFSELSEDMPIVKRLTATDRRVYMAAAALHNAGNQVVSLSQIYRAMGNTGSPSALQVQKIQDAITKMSLAHITIDNKSEADAYTKYPHFSYDGALLPMERCTAYMNGQLTDAAIRLFREPPLVTFAKERRQITTFSLKVLMSPVSKTEQMLLIEDYLIDRISRARNDKRTDVRIRFTSIHEHANITTAKQKARVTEKVERLLDHYMSCQYNRTTPFIKSYALDDDGVTIRLK